MYRKSKIILKPIVLEPSSFTFCSQTPRGAEVLCRVLLRLTNVSGRTPYRGCCPPPRHAPAARATAGRRAVTHGAALRRALPQGPQAIVRWLGSVSAVDGVNLALYLKALFLKIEFISQLTKARIPTVFLWAVHRFRGVCVHVSHEPGSGSQKDQGVLRSAQVALGSAEL